MKILTWNCNGIRARFPLIKKIIELEKPDLLFLQETKIEDKIFPEKEFHNLGYEFLFYRGEKSYNGVACISKMPFSDCGYRNWYNINDCRHIFVKIKKTTIHNFYIPAGGDIPDTSVNSKFLHKISFLREMENWLRDKPSKRNEIILGDLNIAPLAEDVWSHKQLLNVVSHTPQETDLLHDVLHSGSFEDLIRQFFPIPEKVFSWWSYRSKNWRHSDRGRRLDHVWATSSISKRVSKVKILKDARGWAKPSDHVPILVEIDLV